MERKYLDALLLLAGIEPVGVYEVANGYWGAPRAGEPAPAPWWLVLTKAGPVVIGWRKSVISINWADTSVRARMTGDDQTTSDLEYCHAWGYAKAVEYLQTLRKALDVATAGAGAPQAA